MNNSGQNTERLQRIKYYHLLIRKFNHGDLPDRISAAKELANFPNNTTTNALTTVLLDVPFELKLAISETLIKIKAEDTDDILIKLYSKSTNK
jgi:HEAT repeat protein